MKEINHIYHLPIHFLISTLSILLFVCNFINGLLFFGFRKSKYYYLVEFVTLLIYSFYKSLFFATIILALFGWLTISFFDYTYSFKIVNRIILIYDLFFSFIILLSIYFIQTTSKLNLFYIKNISEYLTFLGIIIYSIVKKIIPLIKQMKYEQKIRSDFVKCIKFKFKRLFFTAFLMFIYILFLINSPFLEHKIFYKYIDNFHIHLIFQFFYENVLLIFVVILFYPKKLPIRFFEDIVFNYKIKVFLLANISEKEKNRKKNNKLNISNLTFQKLKKLSKKDNYPLVLINPFTFSNKKSLFHEVHIGIAERYEKKL